MPAALKMTCADTFLFSLNSSMFLILALIMKSMARAWFVVSRCLGVRRRGVGELRD